MSIEETQPALVEALQERLLKEIGRGTADAPRNAKDLSIALGVAIDKLPVLEDATRYAREKDRLKGELLARLKAVGRLQCELEMYIARCKSGRTTPSLDALESLLAAVDRENAAN